MSDLKSVVLEAGELLKEGYHASKEITYKSAIDLMTQYDLQIELFLKERLAQLYPDFELIGEETSCETKHPKKAIYIDPIDGTTNFVHKIPFVAISIGIWQEHQPIEAVVYNPILDEYFYAKKGEGAFLNGKAICVTQTKELHQGLIATGFPYTKIDKGRDYEWTVKSFENILPYVRDIRRLGSAAIDLCNVARGVIDGYYEINLKPWDVSAGILILEEAGGKVSTDGGNPYFLTHRSIVASNNALHEQIVEKLDKL